MVTRFVIRPLNVNTFSAGNSVHLPIILYMFRQQIIMSSEAFREISHLKLEYPLLFELKNPRKPRINLSTSGQLNYSECASITFIVAMQVFVFIQCMLCVFVIVIYIMISTRRGSNDRGSAILRCFGVQCRRRCCLCSSMDDAESRNKGARSAV